ncbi:MAG: hypothetical protein HC836_19590 [Richelia sp. RM2_1_2]|nr:hypothetical protein [Richelia sp. RM1_1_1]NJO60388.1 hypothetical protein [Richelia sp. RM2_1_2]
MSTVKNGEKRQTKIKSECENSQFDDIAGGVGNVQEPSPRGGINPFRTTRNDSQESKTNTQYRESTASGKILSELVDETQKQLAFHEQQVEVQKRRLENLAKLTKEFDIQ